MPKVSGPWDTFGTTDIYPTGFANLQQGGLHVVANTTERDAITDNRRGVGEVSPKRGIAVFVTDLGQIHYKPASQSDVDLALNNNWQILSIAGTALSFVSTLDGTAIDALDGTGRSSGDFYIVDSGTTNHVISNADSTMTEVDGLTVSHPDYLVYDGTKYYWINNSSFTGNITIAQVTGLQTALDDKFSKTTDVVNTIDDNNSSQNSKVATVGAIKNYVINSITGNVDVLNYLKHRDTLTGMVEGDIAVVIDARPYTNIVAVKENGAPNEITDIQTNSQVNLNGTNITLHDMGMGVANATSTQIQSETFINPEWEQNISPIVPVNGDPYPGAGFFLNDDTTPFTKSYIYDGSTWQLLRSDDLNSHVQNLDTTNLSILNESSLKDIITAGKANLITRFADTNNILRVYQLFAGTDAESSPNVIRPNDYNASTNPQVWKLLGYNINNLLDVNAASPSNGQALIWNSGTSKWIPGTVASDPNQIVASANLSTFTSGGHTTFDLSATAKAHKIIEVAMNQAFDGNLTFTGGVKGVQYIIRLTTSSTAYSTIINLAATTKVKSGSALIAPNSGNWVHDYHVHYDGTNYWVSPEYDQN